MKALIEVGSKPVGAERRAFFKGIDPLLKASLLVAIQTLQPHLWGDIVYVAGITIRGKPHLNRPTGLNYSAFLLESADKNLGILYLDCFMPRCRKNPNLYVYI